MTDLVIPEGITIINDYALCYDTCLTSVTIPNSVTSIGDYAFMGCSNLTSVTIPSSVTSIGGSAFQGCSKVASITIPNSVERIGEGAFFDCKELKIVRCLATYPLTHSGSSRFGEFSVERTLYVPCRSLESYNNSGWSDAFGRIECISNEPIDYSVTAVLTDDAVTFEWSSYPNAATYTLDLKYKYNYESYWYEFTFDDQGKGVDNDEAELTQEGKFRYHWNSLISDTEYFYQMCIKDNSGNPICICKNNFTTGEAEPEPIEATVREIHSDNAVYFDWSVIAKAASYELFLQSTDKSQYGSEIFDSQGNAQTANKHAELTDDGYS